ncbi:MAG TPA: hypothetical protein VLL77_04475 [Anaerolineales bacterium]|nr:hypothetical protein [Anaerolineales bacterium]
MRNPSEPIAPDHPNLVLAVGRLRRLQWLWAGLFAALGILATAGTGFAQPVLPLVWIVIAAVLAIRVQPILLALVAVAWGFSLLLSVPGVEATLGHDPISRLFGGNTIELIALAIVRIILLVTAWNQFLFYRMLYGTALAAGLDESLPAIPAVIPNPSDTVAVWSRLLGFLGVILALASVPLSGDRYASQLLGAVYGLSVFAVGLGLGAAFTPTNRRPAALVGIGLGCVAVLLGLFIGRALLAG